MPKSDNVFLPAHGGDVVAASQRYGIAIEDWIDLSTGVNPVPYPVDGISAQAFYDLPYIRADFMAAARGYYSYGRFGCDQLGCDQLLAVPGSQAAIQALPLLLQSEGSINTILMPELGYKEHEKHWRKAGADIDYYPSFDETLAVSAIDAALKNNSARHLLVINPNNPTCLQFSCEQLRLWAGQLQAGAYLIVDEAFMDNQAEQSLLVSALPNNVIVLRSFGKFFGLAGIRLGFVFANLDILSRLENRIGLWQVSGPAQALAIKALKDNVWHAQAIEKIERCAKLTLTLFTPLLEKISCGAIYQNAIFTSCCINPRQALLVSDFFASRGVLLRIFLINEDQALLRFGVLSDVDQKAVDKVSAVANEFCAL